MIILTYFLTYLFNPLPLTPLRQYGSLRFVKYNSKMEFLYLVLRGEEFVPDVFH